MMNPGEQLPPLNPRRQFCSRDGAVDDNGVAKKRSIDCKFALIREEKMKSVEISRNQILVILP